ncbi:MAG: hypothetical protein ACRECH_08140 [Nitrososphaerales archaeon]
MSTEGEEALKLYIKKYEKLLGGMVLPDEDPLRKISAIWAFEGSTQCAEGPQAAGSLGDLIFVVQ